MIKLFSLRPYHYRPTAFIGSQQSRSDYSCNRCLFFLPDTYFLFWEINCLFTRKHAQTQARGCMDVFIKEEYVQTDTHLLTLFKHSQPLSYFCPKSFNRNSHTDTKQIQWESTRMCSKESTGSQGESHENKSRARTDLFTTHTYVLRLTVTTHSQKPWKENLIVLNICKSSPHVNIFSMCPVTVMNSWPTLKSWPLSGE